jgi:hypothetical protein
MLRRSRCCLCVCLYVYSRIVASQRLCRNVTVVTNTHATIEELLDASFSCGPCRIKESRRLVVPRTSCFLSSFRSGNHLSKLPNLIFSSLFEIINFVARLVVTGVQPPHWTRPFSAPLARCSWIERRPQDRGPHTGCRIHGSRSGLCPKSCWFPVYPSGRCSYWACLWRTLRQNHHLWLCLDWMVKNQLSWV